MWQSLEQSLTRYRELEQQMADPAVIADRFLLRLKRAGFNPFAPELAAPDPLQSWRLAAAALRNRF